jgi:hypothetical protein
MNKDEWGTCADPGAMLRWLQVLGNVAKTQGGKRRLRLLLCACARRLLPLIGDDRAGQVVGLAERFADGAAGKADLAVGKGDLDALRKAARGARPRAARAAATLAALLRPSSSIGDAVEALTRFAEAAGETAADAGAAREAERAAQCDLLREVFADGYRRPHQALPAHVVGLAEACYAAFPAISDQFRILADALDEAGEPQAASHCRSATHAKGCHVLDWALQRE